MEITGEYIRAQIAAFLKIPVDRLSDEIPLARLIADSFVIVEMLVDLQEQFGIQLRQQDLAAVVTLGDLIGLLLARAAEPATADPAPAE